MNLQNEMQIEITAMKNPLCSRQARGIRVELLFGGSVAGFRTRNRECEWASQRIGCFLERVVFLRLMYD